MRFAFLITSVVAAVAADAAATPKRQSVQLDTDTINAAVEHLQDAINSVSGVQNSVSQEFDGITSQFTGLAQQSIRGLLNQANDQANSLVESWGQVASILQTAGETFQSVDDINSDQFST